MASRRSHAPTIAETPISTVSRWDTYPSETHCKLRRSAAVGQASLHPLLVPQSGTDYHPQHHTGCVSPPSGNYMGWKYRTYPQLILNLQIVRGCVATAGRHSLLSLYCKLMCNLTDKLQFTCYSTKKTPAAAFLQWLEFLSFKYLIRLCMVHYLNRAVYFIIFMVLPSAVRTMLMPRCSFWSFIPEAL